MMKKPFRAVVIFFIVLACILFSEFVLTGRPPFPGNYLQAWYEPWRSLHFENGRILLPHKPVAEDIFRHLLPFRVLGVDDFAHFQLPLWNPYNGAGQPLMATLNSGFLDPFNVLFFLLPLASAYGTYLLLQFVLIGVATYVYARSLRLRNVASLFAACAFSLSGFVTVRLIYGIYGLALAILPFSLFLIETYRDNKRSKSVFFIPILTATMLVATQTQIALYFIGFITLYGLFRLRHPALFLILLFLGIGLSSVQLFPTYELMRLSHISPGGSAEVIGKFLVPVQYLISVAIPNYFGNPSTYNFWGYGDFVQTVGYVGLLTILLAMVGTTTEARNRSLSVFYALSVVVSFLLAVDWPGSRLFYAFPIPVLSTGAPSRILVIATFGLSMLSGIGLEKLVSTKKLPRSFILSALGVSLFAIGILAVSYVFLKGRTACRFGVISYCWDVALRNTLFAAGIFFAELVLLTTVLVTRAKRKVFIALAVVFFISFLLPGIYNAQKFYPHTPTSDLFPDLPVVRALQEKTRDARVLGIGEAMIASDLATQLRIYDPQFYHPLYILRYRELLEYANNGYFAPDLPRGEPAIKDYYSVSEDLIERRERLLNLASVRHRLYKKTEIAAPPAGNVTWEDDTWLLVASAAALPRAYVVNNVVVEPDPVRSLETLFAPSFDISDSVVLEKQIPLTDANPITEKGIARVETYDSQRVVISTNAPGNSILVLTDNFYPGWNAYVDGVKTEVYRANYTFRAITLPNGSHEVVFRYEPASVRYGALFSFLSLITIIFLYGKSKIRNR